MVSFEYAGPIRLAFQPTKVWPSETNGDSLAGQVFSTTVPLYIRFFLSETVSFPSSISHMA